MTANQAYVPTKADHFTFRFRDGGNYRMPDVRNGVVRQLCDPCPSWLGRSEQLLTFGGLAPGESAHDAPWLLQLDCRLTWLRRY